MKRLGGYAALATAFMACPCHLVLTLPLATAVLGGTALGAFLADNPGLVFGLSLAYFVGALLIGLRLLNQRTTLNDQECSDCLPETRDRELPLQRPG